jgi:hypothetical protein
MSLNCLIEFLQDAVANCVQISGWREPTVVDEFRFEKSRVDAMLVELAALKTMEDQRPPTNTGNPKLLTFEEIFKRLCADSYTNTITPGERKIAERVYVIMSQQLRAANNDIAGEQGSDKIAFPKIYNRIAQLRTGKLIKDIEKAHNDAAKSTLHFKKDV